MKKLKSMLVTLAMLLCSISASAEDFSVDGIYYNITDSEKLTVEVTYRGSSYSEYSNEYSGSVVIPETVTYDSNTYSVTSIYYSTFSGCSSLTSVTIPNSVTSIGDKAFYNCYSLPSVTIPNGVTSIGSDAFSGTLWYNNQPDGVIYAGKVAYNYKGTMPSNTSIELAEGTLGIAGGAFYNCSSLTSVTIPDGVTSIGGSAFSSCRSLTSVTIPNSVTSIGSYAFNGCSSLTSVHISDIAAWCNIKFGSSESNPLYYAEHLYMNGKEITELVIPDGVTSIGEDAFCNCSNLTSVTIPDGVTSIGDNTFFGCSNLTSVTIPNSVTSIGWDAFFHCI